MYDVAASAGLKFNKIRHSYTKRSFYCLKSVILKTCVAVFGHISGSFTYFCLKVSHFYLRYKVNKYVTFIENCLVVTNI